MTEPQYKKEHDVLIRLYLCLDKFKSNWATHFDLRVLYQGVVFAQRLAGIVEEQSLVNEHVERSLACIRSAQERYYDRYLWTLHETEQAQLKLTFELLHHLIDYSSRGYLAKTWREVERLELPA